MRVEVGFLVQKVAIFPEKKSAYTVDLVLENAVFCPENRCKNGEDPFFWRTHFFRQKFDKITDLWAKKAI